MLAEQKRSYKLSIIIILWNHKISPKLDRIFSMSLCNNKTKFIVYYTLRSVFLVRWHSNISGNPNDSFRLYNRSFFFWASNHSFKTICNARISREQRAGEKTKKRRCKEWIEIIFSDCFSLLSCCSLSSYSYSISISADDRRLIHFFSLLFTGKKIKKKNTT